MATTFLLSAPSFLCGNAFSHHGGAGARRARLSLSSSPTPQQQGDAPSLEGTDDVESSANDAMSDALWNVQAIMDPASFSSLTDETLSRFRTNCVDAVTVKQSSIPGAGLGLFARRDIPAGTIVSLYPVHAIAINFFEGGCSWVTLGKSDDDYFFSSMGEKERPNYSLYLLGNRPRESDFGGAMFVDCNPNRPEVPGWLAHYINDGAVIQENSEAGVLDYLKSSRASRNCVICPWGPSPLLAAFTTKEVQRGQELFTSYGMTYWLDAFFAQEEWTAKTDRIMSEVKIDAENYFSSMDSANEIYCTEANALHSIFNAFD